KETPPVQLRRAYDAQLHLLEPQFLDGIERNDSDRGTDPELLEVPVRVAQHVIEEAVVLVPEQVVPPSCGMRGSGARSSPRLKASTRIRMSSGEAPAYSI